jgi:hypothetical protein
MSSHQDAKVHIILTLHEARAKKLASVIHFLAIAGTLPYWQHLFISTAVVGIADERLRLRSYLKHSYPVCCQSGIGNSPALQRWGNHTPENKLPQGRKSRSCRPSRDFALLAPSYPAEVLGYCRLRAPHFDNKPDKHDLNKWKISSYRAVLPVCNSGLGAKHEFNWFANSVNSPLTSSAAGAFSECAVVLHWRRGGQWG